MYRRIIVKESSAYFGAFSLSKFFYIEKSKFYREKLKDKGVKTTEFILLKDKKLFFVEIKTTAPRIQIQKECKKCDQYVAEKICIKCQQAIIFNDWNMYVNDLKNKYQDSLVISLFSFSNIGLRLHKMLDKKLEISLLLIITTTQPWALNKDNIEQIQRQLCKQLAPLLKLWGAKLIVLNRETADKYGFIYHFKPKK